MILTADLTQQTDNVNDALELVVAEVDVLPIEVVVVVAINIWIAVFHLFLKCWREHDEHSPIVG